MEFLDPVAKKRHLRNLFIGYGLLTVLIGLSTYLLILMATGLDFFNLKGEVIQNGLLFVDSQPDGAQVSLNGKPESRKTNGKYVLGGDDYNVQVKLDGYRSWQKRVSVLSGRVKNVRYIKLIPDKLSPGIVEPLDANLGFVSQSPDKRWLVVQTINGQAGLSVYDLNSSAPKAVAATLPIDKLVSEDGLLGSLKVNEWADDNRHFLIQQTLPSGRKIFLLVDRQTPAEAVNLNTDLASDPTSLILRSKKYDQYYLLFAESGELKRADLKSKTVAPALLDQVLAFETYGDDLIAYATTKDSLNGETAVKIYDGSKSYTLANTAFASDGHYFLDIASYQGNWYYMVGSSATDKVLIYRNPLNFIAASEPKAATPSVVLKTGGAIERAGFSESMRLASIFSRKQIAVYDFEDAILTKANVSQLSDASQLSWADDFHYAYSDGTKYHLVEFDGQNDQALVEGRPGLNYFFNKDQSKLFTIADLSGNTVLESTSLKK